MLVVLSAFGLLFVCVTVVSNHTPLSLSPSHLRFQTSEGPYCIRIYERPNFQGQMMEFSEDCESTQDHFRSRDIYSCNVLDGYWTLHEHPNYRGRQYFLRPGEYRKFGDWGAACAATGSFRRITDF